MKLDRGILIANTIKELVAEYCDRFDVAGSVRRKVKFPSDLEILITPKEGMINKIANVLLRNGARIMKGTFVGREVRFVFMDQKIDFYIPQSFDYYRILAIRTGSQTYSKSISAKWSKMGYEGTPKGLQPIQLKDQDGPVVTWESEKHFFDWMGMDWLEPADR